MGIYRGAGGSGDAVNDSSSEALITIQARDQALAAQAAAEAAQAAAELAETNAETAETNAETAETNAETAATNAANSASAASTSASNAASSASAASTSASNASTSATNAANSASAASTSASNAASSASTATTQATNASNSASAAATSATNASNSASAAATSATNAANSATAAQTAKTAAELAETNAETAEANAELAETNAETAATNAAASESAAASSASNAASSASSASTSASNAATSATNAANSASAASTSATNAANSASAALTSENNAASSASAAATSASNAATSATSASNSASAAATSETNAANSASAAATSASNASTSASNAATSATNASNSASAAATSATNASNSASAAATSATNAATSESNAASSASAAAASYDSFDDRYLGAKSSAPTLDNDGNTLLVGALYYDTVSSSMKVWSGSAWLDAYASLSGALLATNNLSDLNNTATARTNLGVAIGVNVQAWDADLDTWATKTAPSGTVVGTSDSQTLTNKTIALGSNTVSGTLAQFNTAVTDADLVSIAGSETLTNKTLTSPTINTATISGGTINNAAIGGTTPAAGSFTSLTDSGNLTFTGTGNRITGDFSNATHANRVLFQTSTTNLATSVGVIPNGTAVGSRLNIYNSSDTANYSAAQIEMNNAEFRIANTISGTGTYLPLTMYTGGSERLRIDTSGNVGIGTSSPVGRLEVTGGYFAANTGASVTGTGGPSTGQSLEITYGAVANTARLLSYDRTGAARKDLLLDGLNLLFNAGSSERMRIDSSGNVGIGTSTPAARIETNVASGNNEFRQSVAGTARAQFIASTTDQFIVNLGSGAQTFYTGGSERMRIDSNGNIGIGTSSPNIGIWSRALTLNTASGNTALELAVNGAAQVYLGADSSNAYLQVPNTSSPLRVFTGGSERMRIDTSGNVGIGTSSPKATLEVNSGYGTGTNSNTVGSSIGLNAGATQPILGIRWTGVSHTGISGSNYVSQIVADGANNNALEVFTTTAKPLVFGTTALERMRIDSSGNVGIGLSNPSTALHVNGYITASGGNAYIVANRTSVTSGQVGYNWATGGSNIWWSYLNVNDTNNALRWYNSVLSADAMTLTTSGALSATSFSGSGSGLTGTASSLTAGAIVNQANSATITASTGVNASQIVQRDGNGYIYANHVNFNTSESENPVINSFITSNGDGWSRKSSLNHVRNTIGLRAWVYFNGGSASVIGSYNVGSVTRNSGGQYTINFTTSLPNGNYAAAGMSYDNGNNGRCVSYDNTYRGNATNGLGITVVDFSYNRFDANRISVIVCG